jgi:hypothetical protein
MARAARPSRWIMLGGAACIVIVAAQAHVGEKKLVGESDDVARFTYLDVSRTGIEIIGRSLITTVVFCLIVLNMVYAEWRNNQTMTLEIRNEHEAEMSELLKFAQTKPQELTQV